MELTIIQFIQQFASPLLDRVFTVITMMGEELFLLGVVLIVYYCFDKQLGLFLCFSMLTTAAVNQGIKQLVRAPRPIGQPGVRSLRVHTAGGYSFPSGHTQSATAMFYSLYRYLERRWLAAVTVAVGLLVGLSRLYLGVHWPKDVLAGLILAVVLSEICYRLYKNCKNPLPLFLLGFGILLLAFYPLGMSDSYFKAIGCMGGLCVGCWFEQLCVKFKTAGVGVFKKVLRCLLGGGCMALVLVGMKYLLPATQLGTALRYGMTVFAGIGVAPLLFKSLRI